MTATAPAKPIAAQQFTTTLWTVAWTGGYEDPSFQSFTDQQAANEQFEVWKREARDHSDRVTLIENVIASDGIVTSVKIDGYCPAWE